MTSPTLFCLLSAVAYLPPAPAHKIEIAPVQQVEAVMTYNIVAPSLEAKEWILFAARAPELPGQIKVSSTLTPNGRDANELSELRRPILLGRVPVRGGELEKAVNIKVVYKAELLSRKLVPLDKDEKPPEVNPLNNADRKAALGNSDILNFADPKFQEWLDTNAFRKGRSESELEFARRVFLKIKKDWTYEYKAEMDRRASTVCKLGKSDCGGLSALFIATLRANQVPGRLLAGRWAMSAKPGEKLGELPFYQYHVKSEFYGEGIGWVPVDMSAAIEQRGGDEFYHFGNDRGNFMVLHVDPELVLDSIHFGKAKITWMQSPAYWVTGGGKLDGTKTTQDWQVKAKKLEK
jgi:Transglutaminase-like superfamily